MSSEEDSPVASSKIDIDFFEVDLLISLIENRPILWDKTLNKFPNHNEKRKVWWKVFGLMKPEFEEFDHRKQKLIGEFLICYLLIK